ncbi:hypothetical protein HW35_01485 [Bacillus sp. X1(2014)]|nr:hypothetical protein HW35_01485 [Bacillus sp. X1(2014)]
MCKKKHAEKYSAIGKAIKELRRDRNLTQEELAEKLGISKSYISKIEAKNTDKSFSIELLFDLAEFFEVDLSYFFKYLSDK